MCKCAFQIDKFKILFKGKKWWECNMYREGGYIKKLKINKLNFKFFTFLYF